MPEWTREQQTERVRRRIRAAQDPDRYNYTPAKENNEYADINKNLRVAIYVRVSTLRQTSSFELQQKYYEDLVRRYPKWILYRIYSDEGKSGVTTQQRDGFNEMMKDAMDQKFEIFLSKWIQSHKSENAQKPLEIRRFTAFAPSSAAVGKGRFSVLWR